MTSSAITPMQIALEEARLAARRGEVPVGATISRNGQVLVRAGNRTRALNDPTAHAEVLVIREACSMLGQERLSGLDLHVTLEPCAMCAGAISLARIRRLYFGAEDVKGGAVINGGRFFSQATCHHAPDIYSAINETESARLMKDFFAGKRI